MQWYCLCVSYPIIYPIISGFLPKNSMMGPLEKIGMVLIVCGLVVCAISMFLLQDVASLRKINKKIIFTPGKKSLSGLPCSFLYVSIFVGK